MSISHRIKEKKETNLDAPETTLQHRELVLKKAFLKKIYTEWYQSFLKETKKLPEGKLLEIGSGGGFLKDLEPKVITSDILELPHCDMVFSAEEIPLKDNSVSAIFMLNVLHHIPDCKNFFKEAERVLVKGGILFMIEPANTVFSRFIYQKFHHEPFDMKVKWEFPKGSPLSLSNQALPSIIFQRDLDKFHKLFPTLKYEKTKLHTPFRYLMTGGLSFKSLVPGWSFSVVSFFEKLLTPLFPCLAMFQTITVKKL